MIQVSISYVISTVQKIILTLFIPRIVTKAIIYKTNIGTSNIHVSEELCHFQAVYTPMF